MIITQNKSKEVVQSHDFKQVNCTIDAEDMRYVASLLRNNYSNTRLAVVREISANALDANAEANSSRKIEVKLPTSLNPSFEVRDFGGGLSEEDVFGLYSKYGKSTKRTSNNYIGAFGIGKFAPLSYGDNFTCTSFHNGTKTCYNVFVDENDDTKIVRLHDPEPSSEPTGLLIGVAVSDSDTSEFRSVVQSFFKFFSEEDMPKFIGVENDFISLPDKILSSKNDRWFFTKNREDSYGYNSNIIMGRVAYPIDPDAINLSNFISKESLRSSVHQLLRQSNFFVRVPLGSVRLHHSRESLEYNKQTQKEIAKAFLEACQNIQTIAKEKLADSEDLFDAKRNFARVINALPYQLRSIFENSFEWNSMKIETPFFQRDYSLQDDLILTEYTKCLDSSSRNGFKVKACKVSRIACQDNFLFMVQNLSSSHGNNLRVRTLMNEDDNLEGVYVIHATNDKATDHLYNEWNFNLIDKKHIRYTDSVAKEKVVRNKVSGNKSRAMISLFKMVHSKGYGHRNADYWNDVNDPINSLELNETKGAIDGKLIYVPIKNYQVIEDRDENLNLEKAYKQMQAFRRMGKKNELSELSEIDLFGVRVKDVAKLDKDTWISLHDFHLDYCKKMVLDDKDNARLGYKNVIVNSEGLSLHNYNYDLGNLFSNETFDPSPLGEDHIIAQAQEDWGVYSLSKSQDHALNYAVAHVHKFDSNWLIRHFGAFSGKYIKDNLEAITEKYPLLRIVAEECNANWVNLKSSIVSHDRNSKINNPMIIDYILMCDRGGEV